MILFWMAISCVFCSMSGVYTVNNPLAWRGWHTVYMPLMNTKKTAKFGKKVQRWDLNPGRSLPS